MIKQVINLLVVIDSLMGNVFLISYQDGPNTQLVHKLDVLSQGKKRNDTEMQRQGIASFDR
jgi:hypothetical protein